MANLSNPSAIAAKWSARAASSAGDYKAGIQAVTENPMDKAAAKADVWQQRVSDPATKAKFVANLSGRNINDWKGPAIAKGASNYVTGVQAGKDKMTMFLNDFLPFLTAAKAQVDQMPTGTYEERKAKAAAMMDLVHQYQRRR